VSILNKGKRGQVWSYDLIVGSILFVIAMGILAFFWWSARTNMSENKDVVIQESAKLGDLLISPGIPTEWNTSVNITNQNTWSSIRQIGLTEGWDTNVISVDKLYKFTQMSLVNYSFVRANLRPKYDFYVELIYFNNSVENNVILNGTAVRAGKQYSDITAKAVAKTDRIVVYNHSVAILRLYIWSDYIWD